MTNTSPIPSVNVLVASVWRLSPLIMVSALSLTGYAYKSSIAAAYQIAMPMDRFLLTRYAWYRRWIASVYLSAALSVPLNWLTHTYFWCMLPLLYAVVIPPRIFAKHVEDLAKELNLPLEYGD